MLEESESEISLYANQSNKVSVGLTFLPILIVAVFAVRNPSLATLDPLFKSVMRLFC
jgi:formylmethanofuran dehydrogenase subunit D